MHAWRASLPGLFTAFSQPAEEGSARVCAWGQRMEWVKKEHKDFPKSKCKTVKVCLGHSRGAWRQQLSCIWGRSASLQCKACPVLPHPDTERAEYRSLSPGAGLQNCNRQMPDGCHGKQRGRGQGVGQNSP